ncbi:MAG: Asp-tRNA(Asn)/Glu-tRNA(Gln) amidotransferase subunit GatC [Oscillospiraceae bacterium]|nr:Asp-tRNA(Asn)/Glu-tRNA(Gln) amidotransferase subunit GatC [Oscillospiraceae bacterium]
MDKDVLRRLQKLNQLSLTEEQQDDVLAFFARQEQEIAKLSAAHTEQVERMVHVMPIMTVVREDVEKKLFTRDELQQGAPEATDGYWQVPRLLE